MGYLSGTLWILAGAVFAGAVQDMTILFISARRDVRSLADVIRSEMAPAAGAVAGVDVLLITTIVIAVLNGSSIAWVSERHPRPGARRRADSVACIRARI
jgi:carbon starvation protein CstA